MTASTVYGVQATLATASPRSVVDRKFKGFLQVTSDTIAVATTSIDEVGDIMLFTAGVPSNARIRSIVIRNSDLDTHSTPTLAVDVGAYYSGIGHSDKSKAKGVVIDADAFASAVTTLQAENLVGVDVRIEAASTIDETQMEVWEAAGLSADCGGEILIGLTVTTQAATAATGKIVVEVSYVA